MNDYVALGHCSILTIPTYTPTHACTHIHTHTHTHTHALSHTHTHLHMHTHTHTHTHIHTHTHTHTHTHSHTHAQWGASTVPVPVPVPAAATTTAAPQATTAFAATGDQDWNVGPTTAPTKDWGADDTGDWANTEPKVWHGFLFVLWVLSSDYCE